MRKELTPKENNESDIPEATDSILEIVQKEGSRNVSWEMEFYYLN